MRATYTRGLSLIDTVVGVALLLIIFLALFGMFRASIALTAAAKARAGATALATEQMEYIRSVTYANTGTVGGIPQGVIPQEEERILNGRTYTVRTFIQYVDDPKDGEGVNDETSIITDYKKIKVDVIYEINGREDRVTLVSNRTPKGIETTEGGGNLRINVINALGESVSGAQVRIQNTNTTPTTDVTTFTGSGGFVFLPGAATSTGYRVTVSKTSYSSAQTYDQDSSNVSPNPGHLTIVEAETTQSTFIIDVLSTLRVETYEAVRDASVVDSFTSANRISETENVEVSLGSLALTSTEGVYSTSGYAVSTSTTPTYLSAWDTFSATSTKPAGTSVTYQILYDADGTKTLLPEEVLPGNLSGFTSTPINLRGVSTTTYPTLYARANLATSDTGVSPEVDMWEIAYDEGPVPIPNVPFILEGSKTIGEESDGTLIKKHVINASTGPAGWNDVLNIEWDLYALTTSGYDIEELCSPGDLSIAPNTTNTVRAYLTTNSAHSLRVMVQNEGEVPIEDAVVTVSRPGFSGNDQTGSCGQAYVGGLQNQNDYDITISKSGYVTEVIEDVSVVGDTVVGVVLTAS